MIQQHHQRPPQYQVPQQVQHHVQHLQLVVLQMEQCVSFPSLIKGRPSTNALHSMAAAFGVPPLQAMILMDYGDIAPVGFWPKISNLNCIRMWTKLEFGIFNSLYCTYVFPLIFQHFSTFYNYVTKSLALPNIRSFFSLLTLYIQVLKELWHMALFFVCSCWSCAYSQIMVSKISDGLIGQQFMV